MAAAVVFMNGTTAEVLLTVVSQVAG